MARRKSASLSYDIKQAIQEVDQIGKSKRDARKNGDKRFIHSYKQKKETMSVGQNFAQWAKQHHQVKRLTDVTETHYRAYIAFKQQEGISKGHLKNIETGLRHIEKGLALKAARLGKQPIQFTTNKRLITGKPTPINRSYRQEEFEHIRPFLSANGQAGVDLMRHLGLRVEEATQVRAEHFQQIGDNWRLVIKNGQGITKGGRYRFMSIPERFNKRLEALLSDKRSSDRLVPIKRDTLRENVRNAFYKAGLSTNGRGAHGFRHLYARDRFKHLLKERQIGSEGYDMLQRIIENKDIGRAANYGIHQAKHDLFRQVEEVVNLIHAEMGHGAGRWDLAKVYLRGES